MRRGIIGHSPRPKLVCMTKLWRPVKHPVNPPTEITIYLLTFRNYIRGIVTYFQELLCNHLSASLSYQPKDVLDVFLPKSSPKTPVLSHPRQLRSRDHNQAVAPSCWSPIDTSGPWTPLDRFLAP